MKIKFPVLHSAVFQIFILIIASFAFAFILSENRVDGQLDTTANYGGEEIVGDSSNFHPAPAGTDFSFAESSTPVGAGLATNAPVATVKDTSYIGGQLGLESAATANLIDAVAWAGIVYFGIQWLGGLFGFDEGLTNALSYGAVGSVLTYQGIELIQSTQTGANLLQGSLIGNNSLLFSLGIGVAIFLATYKKEKQEIVRFECLPWEAPLGGQNCAKCNEDIERPCSEYRCKSLGQACDIVNKGTDEELCVWVHKEDTQSPTIQPDDKALKPQGLRYIPDNTIRPPNRGWKIISQRPDGCLPAYTKLEFGIELDEPGQCRIDYEASNDYKTEFDNMAFLFGENNLYSELHNQMLRVPDPFSSEGDAVPEIHNDGTYTLWARCQDANGNKNEDAVAFRFCVDKGPDTFAPEIVGTSIKTNSPVRFNADRVKIEVYTNEPAQCRWSKQIKDYEIMENEMNCATQVYQVNADLNYICNSELKGIENKKDNQFYFRCKDYSTAGPNVMAQSYPLLLRGTEELVITQVGPNGTISGGVNDVGITLNVRTAFGETDGNARCYFADNVNGEGNLMFSTGGNTHTQTDLQLIEGNYEYFFRCVDDGGNSASASTKFSVEVDRIPPAVTRVYRDGENLKIVTSEEAKCAYSLTSCNFNFAEAQNTILLYENPAKRFVHYTDWDKSKTYYIKCLDLQDNGPTPPNTCQVIAKGSEF